MAELCTLCILVSFCFGCFVYNEHGLLGFSRIIIQDKNIQNILSDELTRCLLSLPYTFLDLIFFCFYIFFACKFCSLIFNDYICKEISNNNLNLFY